jgi:hypothetical protein
MRNPFTRKKPYEATRRQLLDALDQTPPSSDEYKELVHRLDQIDKIINRSSERFKTVVPALGTAVAVGGIYALQQFAGVIVPKALDSLAARQEQKKSKQDD